MILSLLVWACARMGVSSCGHVLVWACARVGMCSCGHVLVWAFPRVGICSCGHVLVWHVPRHGDMVAPRDFSALFMRSCSEKHVPTCCVSVGVCAPLGVSFGAVWSPPKGYGARTERYHGYVPRHWHMVMFVYGRFLFVCSRVVAHREVAVERYDRMR